MKLYIVPSGWEGYVVVAETGEPLVRELSGDCAFATGNLELQAAWRQRFGSYEIVELGSDEMTIETLRARHHGG